MTSATASHVSHQLTRSERRRVLLALGLGGTLEWYDWSIFGFLAAFVGPNFFPDTDAVTATLSALAVFAVGFAFRPLGGVVFGLVADRMGRRLVMLQSVSAMAIADLVIGILPTYASIGVWAPAALLLCRIVQGVSAGVEGPLDTAYAVELTPPGQEGRTAGIMSFFVNIAILGCSLVSFVVSAVLGGDEMQAWGWRLPFLIGAALGLVVFYMRRNLPESLGVEDSREQHAQPSTSVWRGIGRHWLGLLAIIFVVGAAQAYTYAWNVGLPNLARSEFHENSTSVFGVTTALAMIQVLGCLVAGRVADRGRLSRTFVVARLLVVPGVFLMLLYHSPGIGKFAVVLLSGGVLLVLNMTLYNVVSTSLMPKACRATGVGLGYGIGVALFGGTASYLLVWLSASGAGWLFPVYVAVLSLISVLFYLLARRHSGVFAGE